MTARTRWIALAVLAAGAVPGAALADPAYLTATGASPGLLSFNTTTGVFGPRAGAGLAPVDAALAPDGSTAYVVGTTDASGGAALTPVELDTGVAGPPIALPGAGPIAISPDGTAAYVADTADSAVVPVDLVGRSAGVAISLGAAPHDVAVAPDGRTVYVTTAAGLVPIDRATNGVGATIPVTPGPEGIALSPDGSRAYVASPGDSGASATVTPIDLTTGKALTSIPVPERSRAIAVAPDGLWAYALSSVGVITPVNLVLGTAATPLPRRTAFGYFDRITLTPDGRTALIVNHCEDEHCLSSGLYRIDLSSMAASGPTSVSLGRVYGVVAVAPSPQAVFGFAPSPAVERGTVAFDASESVDAGGAVSTYAWDFGDGVHVRTGSRRVSHAYARAGTYAVTLTTTNAGGCASAAVFTGKMAYCSGSPTATITHRILVTALPSSPITIARSPVRIRAGAAVLTLSCGRRWTQPSCVGVLVVARGRTRLARARVAIGRGAIGQVRIALGRSGAARVTVSIPGAGDAVRSVRFVR